MEFNSVVFDMDGVVLNSLVDNEEWKYNAVDEALDEEGVDPESLSKDKKDSLLGDQGYSECVKTAKEVGVNPRKVWNTVAEKTTLSREQQLEDRKFELYDGARDTIEALNDKDIKMGIISNAPEMAVELTIEHFDLKRFFKFYAGVRNFEDLQARKPHPNHLELAKAELKRDPFSYVGDHESDLVAAQRADMSSIWVKRTETDVDVTPDYTVTSAKEIRDIVLDETE
ncbi:MAG: HAD family hydrolase [Candidatus Nanohalobium sp.]